MSPGRYDVAHPLTMADGSGGSVRYLPRRLLPRAGEVEASGTVVVGVGERVDLLAVRTLDDPDLGWCLADANGVRRPSELEQPGRPVRVPVLRLGAGDDL